MRILACLILALLTSLSVEAKSGQRAKYVFYFIGDGMGINQPYGTELYNAAVHGRDSVLAFTRFPVRSYVTNRSASSLITDSAAAATALSTGYKTKNGSLGVDAQGARLKSVAEVVKEHGGMVGVATNVGVNHATPSAFYAHHVDRNKHVEIVEQLIASKVDFAAGSTFLNSDRRSVKPADMVRLAEETGIKVTQNPKEAAQVSGSRVILLSDSLSRKSMRFATDRTPSEPSIVDFTSAAINYLERESKQGFLLMVEAGHLDYSAHDNDAVTTFEEINDLSKSVALALEFYERHPDETLIVVTADHDTGGLSIGYARYRLELGRLAYQRTSEEALTAKIQHLREMGKTEWEDMKQLLSDYLGLWSEVKLRDKDERELRRTFEKSFLKNGELVKGLYTDNEKMAVEAVRILNKRAYLSWSGTAHTGAQVPLFVKGVGELLFLECFDNTDIPKKMAEAMGYTF